MCKSILCDFAMGVVQENVANDKGKLCVCSNYAFDEMVTCTRTSGHSAKTDMQLENVVPHALVSVPMYVASRMDEYLICKMQF